MNVGTHNQCMMRDQRSREMEISYDKAIVRYSDYKVESVIALDCAWHCSKYKLRLCTVSYAKHRRTKFVNL